MKNLISVAFLAMVGCNAAASSDGNPTTSLASIPPKVVVREIHDIRDDSRVDVLL
ncbi:MAG: hypothetical protein HZA50_07795 [Planctomycetes bacterium]|nr:hypothetical protein [Planctomycetota bacterium]